MDKIWKRISGGSFQLSKVPHVIADLYKKNDDMYTMDMMLMPGMSVVESVGLDTGDEDKAKRLAVDAILARIGHVCGQLEDSKKILEAAKSKGGDE